MLAVRLSKDLPIVLESDCFERANHSGLVPLGSMMFKDLGVDFGELSFAGAGNREAVTFGGGDCRCAIGIGVAAVQGCLMRLLMSLCHAVWHGLGRKSMKVRWRASVPLGEGKKHACVLWHVAGERVNWNDWWCHVTWLHLYSLMKLLALPFDLLFQQA